MRVTGRAVLVSVQWYRDEFASSSHAPIISNISERQAVGQLG